MNTIFEEITWKEFDYFLRTGKFRKDTSFTGKDIIRLYENNLDEIEQEEVREYFQQFCEEDIEVVPIEPDEPTLLPPIPIPILPPVEEIPSLPDVIPELPSPIIDLPWLLPVWPFIVPSLMPPDILKIILDYISPPAQAEEIEEKSSEYTPLVVTILGSEPVSKTEPLVISEITSPEKTTRDDVLFPWQIAEIFGEGTKTTQDYDLAMQQFDAFWDELIDFVSQNDAVLSQNDADMSKSDTIEVDEVQYLPVDPEDDAGWIDAYQPRQPEVIWIDFGEGRKTWEDLNEVYQDYIDDLEDELEY